MRDLINGIVENATSPPMVVGVGGSTVVASLLGILPILVNVAVLIYFSLMIVHKGYQMRKEWKADKDASSK